MPAHLLLFAQLTNDTAHFPGKNIPPLDGTDYNFYFTSYYLPISQAAKLMRFFQQQLFQFQEKLKAIDAIAWNQLSAQKTIPPNKEKSTGTRARKFNFFKKQLFRFHYTVKRIGATRTMDDYEKRKLGIFNRLNFFQLITGILIPLLALYHNKQFPSNAWLVASLPALISVVVLWLNAIAKYETGIVFYFIFYPVVTSIVYMSGINLGVELFFILYGILAVFFIQQISQMLFSISLSMISYFMLAVVLKNHRFQLESTNLFLYLFNQLAGIVFIFYGLMLIKKENSRYQLNVLQKNKEIAEKAALLQKQTIELTELNAVKNKLFSIIAHDLKTPMYSLRNLFRNIQQQNLPAKEIKAMLPDVINNLNYTSSLMENLLLWAKTQMQSEGVKKQRTGLHLMIEGVIQQLQLPAAAKQIQIDTRIKSPLFIEADRDMIELVLRNLLSNAIKFTAAGGKVTIGINTLDGHAEVFVKDNGAGIGTEALEKINRNDYFSTNGTAHEPGTGLGLMLCKEFLLKNNSRLQIESKAGKGSRFSFSLPLATATPGKE